MGNLAPSQSSGMNGVVFVGHVQLQKRAKNGQIKHHPSRGCTLADTGFLSEVKPLSSRGPPIGHMLWGEGYPTLKRGAYYACVKMGFYGKRGVFRCFSKNRNTFSGPGYAKCRNLTCVIAMTCATFLESVQVSNSSLFATTDPRKADRYPKP